MVNHNSTSEHVAIALADGKTVEASDWNVGVVVKSQRTFQKYIRITPN